jgi:UDP-N-acetylmuramate--alanine ligase
MVPDVETLPELLSQALQGDDLVLVQGAGNIGKLARRLAENRLQAKTKD